MTQQRTAKPPSMLCSGNHIEKELIQWAEIAQEAWKLGSNKGDYSATRFKVKSSEQWLLKPRCQELTCCLHWV